MVDCYYRLNGELLRTSLVRDIVVRQNVEMPFDSRVTKVAQGSRVVDDLGEGEGTFTIDFHLVGDDPGPVSETRFIIDQITESPWTLEALAPSISSTPALWKNDAIVAFSTISVAQEPTRRFKNWTLSVRATILGVWRACGGDYVTVERGWFEKDGADLKDQDGNVVTDFVVKLPQQETGFPKARAASTKILTTLTPSSTSTDTTRDGAVLEFQHFDMSGFLHPSNPTASGDTGVWEVISSPSKDFLQPTGGGGAQAMVGGTGMEETGFAETGF